MLNSFIDRNFSLNILQTRVKIGLSMQTVSEELIKDKKVLLRYDIDVPIENGKVVEDFRLEAGLETLDFCLEHASEVIMMGHVGRPGGKEDPKYSVKPIVEWFEEKFAHLNLAEGKFHILENLRFEKGEEECDLEFAKKLAELGDVFVNESFAAHHKSASVSILPTLLPHAAGFQFAHEVETLTTLRTNPKHPLVAIIGGAKVDDKYGSVVALSKICEAVLVGGLLPKEIKERKLEIGMNVMLGTIGENGIDLAEESIDAFCRLIKNAKQIIWAGPVGKYEDPEGIRGTLKLAQATIDSGAETIIGGGDTTAALKDLLEKFSFVSTGGGAMLKLLEKGTLDSIEALS